MSNILCSADNNPEKYPETVCQEYNCTGGADDIRFFFKKSLERTVSSVIRTETLRNTAKRVDGLIIGTGEADFTKDNTHYNLRIDDKDFQLIDVPGIEGNETCYTHLVKKAIAQAHLVVYVNGTNKKPETSTAKKIKSYLEYGTQVYPLINVRGYSDDYEFEEDREDLCHQSGADNTLCQSTEVLAPILGNEVLLEGGCVQGMLAFSALAYDENTQSTTIHPSRNNDLVISQQEYFSVFPDSNQMRTFSQIDIVARMLSDKVSTFREDIVESNKGKVRETLGQYLQVLETQLSRHREFLKSTEPEFEQCQNVFRNAVTEFERNILNKRRNRWNALYNTLTEKSQDIVNEYFGNHDVIEEKIRQAFETQCEDIKEQMQKDTEQAVELLQQRLLQAVERLLEDINVAFRQKIIFTRSDAPGFVLDIKGYDLGSENITSSVQKIASYAVGLAKIGSAFPVIGTTAGFIVGAVVGVFAVAAQYFRSKEAKIRNAKKSVGEQLDEARKKKLNSIADDVRQIVDGVNKELDERLLKKVNDMQDSFLQPTAILEKQITRITRLKDQLEKMPYGTIQTVQY
ncbi:DUF1269 domain-containing protein [Escherichia coli]|nr:DUF1269 domain-containing protein [Escherichia coli]